MNKKYLNLLGLANVAKGIVSGETLIKSIAANETKLVVIAMMLVLILRKNY